MKCKRGPGEFCAKEKGVFNHVGRGQESWFKGRRESWDTVRGFERPANTDGFVGAGSRQGETSTGARRQKSRPGVRRGVLVQG